MATVFVVVCHELGERSSVLGIFTTRPGADRFASKAVEHMRADLYEIYVYHTNSIR